MAIENTARWLSRQTEQIDMTEIKKSTKKALNKSVLKCLFETAHGASSSTDVDVLKFRL